MMPESYYERELYLIRRERALHKQCQKDKSKIPAWFRAAQRLMAHENSFGAK